MKHLLFVSAISVCLLLPVATVFSQEVTASSLAVEVDGSHVEGEWQLPLTGLDESLDLDASGDGRINWLEIQHRRQDIVGHLGDRLTLLANGRPADLAFGEVAFASRRQQPWVIAGFTASTPRPIDTVGVACGAGGDPSGCRLRIVWQGVGAQEAVVGPGSEVATFSRAAVSAPGVWESVRSGIHHIWIGYDHILFLLVLLIPAVFRRTATGREVAPDFAGVLSRVVLVVSAFTLAHSVTLTAAARGWVELPSHLVESAIAASVLLAALHNFLPTATGDRSAWLALGFGLLHGFGFASVLSDAAGTDVPHWSTLIGFNVGVELGQLAIVAAFLPLAFLLRTTRFYRTGVLYGGSLAVCVVSALWIWRRAL